MTSATSWHRFLRPGFSCQAKFGLYFDFLNAGKPTPLFFTFTQGVEFFWGVKLDGLEYKEVQRPLDDKKFLPLLEAPKEGHTKFEQILEWAKKEEGEKVRR